MKKVLALCLAVVLSLSTLLVGCGGGNKDGGTASEGEKVKALFVVGNALGDQSFIDSTWRGLQRAKDELGMEVKATELNNAKDKYESGIIDAGEGEYQIIVTTGMEMLEHVNNHAAEFPNKKFIVCDIDTNAEIKADNILGIHYNQNEGDFLAGAVAAIKSETGKIGFIGGMDNPVINDFLVGYIEGAKAVNPDIKVAVSYVGAYNNPTTGGEFANKQINDGVDIIHPVAGGSGTGALQKASERGVYTIGVDSDQYAMFKDSNPKVSEYIITSMLKNVGDSVFEQIKTIKDGGEFKGKQIITLGIKEKAVELVENDNYNKLMSDNDKAKLAEIVKKVENGEITVSTAYGKTAEEIKAIMDSVALS